MDDFMRIILGLTDKKLYQIINVNQKIYKRGNLKMYNVTHSIHPSNGRIHP